MARTWFVTGSSRGLGRAIATHLLEQGDRVVTTARDVAQLDDLAERDGERALCHLAGRPDAPLRLLLGADAVTYAEAAAASLAETDQAWRDVSLSVTSAAVRSC